MKAYEGIRTAEGCSVTVDGRPLDMRMDLRRHSDRPEWGYAGGGPAQLSLALLADAVGDDVAQQHHQKFKFNVVARLDRDRWILTQAEIRSCIHHLLAEGSSTEG